GILAKQMSGKNIKIMTTLHGTDITVLGYDHSLKGAIKFGIEESDIVTSVSHSLAEQTKEIIHTDKEIVPIYNFVRENEFPTRHDETFKTDYGISPNEKVLIHVSNFRSVKRIDTIIETFAKVHEKIPSKLVLLGDGPELIDMRQKTRDLGVEEHVLFLGKQDNVSAFYQLSDLVLLLSEKESFGLTLLEAMKTGVVPIGSNAGGIKEVIKHGETGYIVDVGDSEQATQYAIKLLQDRKLYEQFQSQMLLDIEQRFGSELITDQYEYYYRKMLNKGEDLHE
ncbi:N-acetyl-alpha-D-glucosaminyl L-malate synthase BshA, partial [Staphylococcus warneri]